MFRLFNASFSFSVLVVGVLLFLYVTPLRAQSEEWSTKAQRVLQLAEEIDQRTASSSRYEKKDREALVAQLERLQKRLESTEKLLKQTRKDVTETSKIRAEMADQYQQQMADMKTVEGIFRTALQQTISRFNTSPVSVLHPEKLSLLNTMAAGELLLEIKDMQQYAAMVFDDMEKTATMETAEAPVIVLDGHSEKRLLHRAGGFFLGYMDGKKAVFALPQGNLPASSILAHGGAGKYMISWFRGESEIVPVDITGGTAFKAIEQKQGLREWIEDGGVLLYPILLAGLVGVVITLLKTIHLLGQRKLTTKHRERVFRLIEKNGDAETFLGKIRFCPAAQVLLACVSFKDKGLDAIDSSVEESITSEQLKLERFLSAIGVLASICPLLGLLGTVTGMIGTFQAITIYGTGDPRMMSTGISEALVTTQAGLAVAIPLLLAHHFLKRRVAVLVADMERAGSGITALLSSR